MISNENNEQHHELSVWIDQFKDGELCDLMLKRVEEYLNGRGQGPPALVVSEQLFFVAAFLGLMESYVKEEGIISNEGASDLRTVLFNLSDRIREAMPSVTEWLNEHWPERRLLTAEYLQIIQQVVDGLLDKNQLTNARWLSEYGDMIKCASDKLKSLHDATPKCDHSNEDEAADEHSKTSPQAEGEVEVKPDDCYPVSFYTSAASALKADTLSMAARRGTIDGYQEDNGRWMISFKSLCNNINFKRYTPALETAREKANKGEH